MFTKKIIGLALLTAGLAINQANAQLLINTGGTPQELADLLSGQGVQILNPQITCPNTGWGTYQADVPNFTSQEGLILATGAATNAIGPNSVENRTTNFGAGGNSLLTTVSGFSTFDACKFEFDIIPQGDSIKFDFVFASEEYQEYVGTTFNDVFGFFISGPGIVGDPGLGGNRNIALIPNTTTPVTINNINNGNPNLNPPFPAANPFYFQANPLNPNALIEYDGWTKFLRAESEVQPCETYHLQLIIADASDRLWDSGVFIEKIESNNVQLSATTVGGINNIIEGCNDGLITFTRQNVTNQPLTVEYYLQGTASNGVDYPVIGNPDPNIPATITIPANQAAATLPISTFDDGIDEDGEYILVLIGNPLCGNTISDSLRIYIQDSLNVFIEPVTSIICPGDDVVFSVDSGGVAFSWSPPTFLSNPNIKEPTALNVTSSITYTLTTTVSECIATATAEIDVTNIVINLTPTPITCNGLTNGSIATTISGGEAPYIISWSGPNGYSNSTQNILGLSAGTYTITVTDQRGCTETAIATVTEPGVLSGNISASTYNGGFNVSCFGASNGTVTITGTSGTPGYTYLWDDAGATTGNTLSNVPAGTYNVTITDNNGCTFQTGITLTQPNALVASISNSVNVLCFGQSSGSAIASAAGGVGPYNYQWNSNPPQFNASAQNLPAGNYTVTITDSNGCTDTDNITITQPNAALSATTSQTNVLCFGESTGVASVNVSGGTPNYTYSWNTNPVQTTSSISGLTAGSYQVIITDNNGCSITRTVVITQPVAPLSASITSTTNVNCFNQSTGSATVQANGGTAGYSYTWNTNPVQNGPVASGLSAGTYIVTVSDNNGCTTTAQATINQPAAPLSLTLINQQNINCFGQSTGTAVVAATGGTTSYAYSWNTNPPTNSAVLSGVPAGTYQATVTDANGCTAQLSVTLTQPASPLQASITNIQQVLCFGQSTGSATVTASGGTADYTYLWNDPSAQTTATATGLAAGSYSVLVTDANGCTGTVNVTITQPQSALSGSITAQTNVDCFGNASGAATVIGSGGSGSYSYIWTPGGQTTSTVNGLLAGVYSVSIFDNNGCATPFQVVVNITQPATGLMANLTSPTVVGGWNIACNGDATGSINLDVSGGSGNYTYTWFEANGDTTYTQNLNDLIAGVYTVVIGDDNECTLTQSITLTESDEIDFTFEMTPSLCFGDNEGTLSVNVFGGTPAYGYEWEGPNGFTATNQTSFTQLFGGIYEMTVTDANGCEFYSPVTVTQPEDLVLELDDISLYPGDWNVSCWNSSDGSIDINAFGGTPEYNFVWQGPNNPFFATTQNVSNLAGGTYEVIIIDANNCIENLFIDVVAPDSVYIELDAFQFPGGAELSCVGASDGSITSIVEGGTPDYSYNWSGPAGFPGAITPNLSGLPEGTYVLEITDNNGCISQVAVRIDPPDSLLVDVFSPTYFGGFNISCAGSSTGSIELFIDGGVPGYTVSWTGPENFSSTDVNIGNLIAGEYCATVADLNGCEEIICITLTEPLPFEVSANSTEFNGGWNIDCNGAFTGNITSSTTGGVAPFEFFWDGPGFFSSDNQNLNNLEAGEYCLTALDANFCPAEVCITLTEPDPLTISLTALDLNGFNVSCNGADDGSIISSINGGTEDYQYSWTGPNNYSSSDENPQDLVAGTYCLTIEDINGCSVQNCITLSQPQPLSVILTPAVFAGGVNISCSGGNNGSINTIASNGTPGYTYSWTGPDGFISDNQNISGLVAGIYCVEVTDLNNCTTTSCVELSQPAPLSANPVINPVACNSQATGSVSLNLSGGTEPYTISWSNLQNTETISGLDAGVYTVVVLDANNCLFEGQYEIAEPTPLQLTISSPQFIGGFNIDCNGNDTGAAVANLFGGTADYQYIWSGPNNFSSDASAISGLVAGTYCLEVTDANDCVAESCITITEPEVLQTSTSQIAEVLCNVGFTGAIEASATGGNPLYGYEWTGPNGYTGSGAFINQLEAGEYCVLTTDINGCEATDCITIEEPDALQIDLSVSLFEGDFNITCFNDTTGSINATVIGGVGNYTYMWVGPNGFSSEESEINNLAVGQYCVVVTDENGCVAESCTTLSQPQPISITLSTQTWPGDVNIACFGECVGLVNSEVTGGTVDYTYLWSGTGGVNSSDDLISELCAGSYNLLITDANGCQANESITLTEPDELLVNAQIENATCDAADGSIVLTTTGGSGGNTYTWSNGATTANISNLTGGSYTVEVSDINGCTTEMTFEVTGVNAVQLSLSGQNLLCFNDSTGEIASSISNATAPVSYLWEGPDGFTSTDPIIMDLVAGDYTLTITDANNCTGTAQMSITQPDSLYLDPLFSPFPVSGVDDNISSPGGNDGSILQIVVNGGSGNISTIWSGPDGFLVENAFALNELIAGTYTVLVTDINGCTATQSITLTEPLDLELPNGISPNGDGINDGLIINGLEVYPNNQVIIFNRWGNIVFEQNNYSNQNPWFGENMKGGLLPDGTYFVILKVTGDEPRELNAYLELRR